MLVIREANGAEVLTDHLQARLKVGLQKCRQPGHRARQRGFIHHLTRSLPLILPFGLPLAVYRAAAQPPDCVNP
jgi:hypothetical protein